MRPFVHLHSHSCYSLLDSNGHVKEYANRAKEWDMPAFALTEHRTLASAIQHYKHCKEVGIKPILGIEQDETEDRLIHTKKEREEKNHRNYHLVLLAKNQKGWENIIKISSDASNNGLFDGKERTDIPFIKDNNLGEGIICLTACLGSRLSQLILADKKDEAIEWVNTLQSIFDDVYIELQAHEVSDQTHVNFAALNIAQTMNVPFVITQDLHYLNKEDGELHDLWVQLTPYRTPYDSHDFYMTSPDEIESYCIKHNIPLSAMDTTVEIANSIDNVDPTHDFYMPIFSSDTSEINMLRTSSMQALADYLIDNPKLDSKTYYDRLEEELWVITRKGYAGYFLVIQDILKKAKELGIPTGVRGSVAGSLLSMLIGITKLDPIKYDLLFSRFLNASRSSPPDIDIDVASDRREDLIHYIMDTYGKEHVAQISNVICNGLKGTIKDVLRGLGFTPTESQRVSNMVPDKFPDQSNVTWDSLFSIEPNKEEFIERFGYKESVEQIIEQVHQLEEFFETEPSGKARYFIQRAEGLVRSYGVHAGGVVVSPIPVGTYLPTRYNKKAVAPVVQWDLSDIEVAGGIKIDVLGLETLSVIRQTCENANIDVTVIDNINLTDINLYKPLWNGHTHTLFQAGGEAVKQISKDLHPDTFEEVIDLIALARPGPMYAKLDNGNTMVEQYIKVKKGAEESYTEPVLENLLSPTKGAIIYQETVMRLFQMLADYSLVESDNIRRVVAKKKRDDLLKIRDDFLPRGKEKGYGEEMLSTLFEGIVKFAGYAFPKAHAASYAMMLMITSYLKHYYPVYWMASMMTSDRGKTDKLKKHIAECRRLGIRILGPDINLSQDGFSVEFHDNMPYIRFGLGGIKKVGGKAIYSIIKNRPYTSINEFCERTDGRVVNRTLTMILILAGAFDPLYKEDMVNRRSLVNQFHFDVRKFKEVDLRKKGQPNTAERLREDSYTKRIHLEYEKEYTGLYFSGHPAESIPQSKPINMKHDASVQIAGVITDYREIKDKKGRLMCFITVDTPYDIYDCVIFSYQYTPAIKTLIRRNRIVYLEGHYNEQRDSISINKILATKSKSLST